jgi:DNA-binding transcriptional LysR family regulator
MEHLRGTLAFVTAAREGSFTAAARRLELSPQAVAGSVARLETALDVRLFNRTTRSLSLTEEGNAFLARAEVGLAALEEATQSIRDRAAAPSGLVRLTCGAAFGRRYLLPELPTFRSRYPDVRLDLSFDDRKIDVVREGFDCAIRGGEIVDSSMVARRICGIAGVLVASPAYLKKHGVPKVPEDLHHHHIVMLRFASGLSVPWEFKLKGRTFLFDAVSPAVVVSDTEAVGDAAVYGLGIARVSLHFAWPHLKAGRLKLVLNDFNEPGKRELTIQYPHRQFVAPRVKAFVEFVVDTFAHHPVLSVSPAEANRYAA